MAIDGALSQTAVEAWDKRWITSEGRADWLAPRAPASPRNGLSRVGRAAAVGLETMHRLG